MPEDILTALSFVLMVVILVSILGAIDRDERYLFVGGIGLFMIAHAFITSPESLGAALAFIGIALAAACSIPLLRQQV